MTVTLHVCGCAGTHPGPGRACSGYLVTVDGTRVLLDCGNGSLANLQTECDVTDVDAVVLSHLHPDHVVDLFGLYYARRFHPEGATPLTVYAPARAADFLGQLLPDRTPFTEVCRFDTVAAGDQRHVGPLTLDFAAGRHPVETLATRVTAEGRTLVYTGDTHVADDVVELAAGCDLFACDATWLERQRPLPEGIHCTGAEAGRMARAAGAARLLVTHVLPTNDAGEVAEEAAAAFGGPVTAAADRLQLAV